eukprot:Opistho-1_new@84366
MDLSSLRSVGSTAVKDRLSEGAGENHERERELFEACKAGHLDRVRVLLVEEGVDVNVTDKGGRVSTPLHFAAGYGRAAVVEFLLERGANVLARDEGGLAPLHNACSFGHVDVAALLLRHGTQVDVRDHWNFTPLHEAALKGKVDVCILLLQNGADKGLKNSDGKTPYDVAELPAVRAVLTGEYKKDVLLEAAKRGDVDAIKQILTPLNVNCNAADGRQSTPLHLAAGFNRKGVVEYLLQSGADVHAKDKGGLVPLHNACSYGHYDVAELLIKYGASVNATDHWKYTPLHEAASKDRVEVCLLLMRNGADITLKNSDGRTPFDLAQDSLKEIFTEDSRRRESFEAVRLGDLARLKRALGTGQLNFKEGDKNSTLLHAAAMYPRKAIVDFILKRGADVHARDADGFTPLHLAAAAGHVDVCEALLSAGASVDAVGSWTTTPLHEAASAGRAAVCRLLLHWRASTSAEDSDGRTPLDVARDGAKAVLVNGEATPDPFTVGRNQSNTSISSASAAVFGPASGGIAPSPVSVFPRLPLTSSGGVSGASGAPTPAPIVLDLQPSQANRGRMDPKEAERRMIECAKTGDVVTMQEIITPENVNCRDTSGRHSTPLHFAAGFNRLQYAEILLNHGADVHAKDKGGLV